MKNFLFFVLFALLPSTAFAHAFPTAYSPDGFSATTTMPSEVGIHFSQEVARVSNGIEVFAPDGSKLPDVFAVVDKEGIRTLSRTLSNKGDGVYVVSWHGVSAEDGHFTKGAFSFFVGAASATPELYGGVSSGMNTERGGRYKTMTTVFVSIIGVLILVVLFALLFLFRREGLFGGIAYKRLLRVGIGLCVLSFAVLMMTSSPPLPEGALWSTMRMDAGRMIMVSDPGEEVNALRIRAHDVHGVPITESAPTVLLDNVKEAIGPLLVPAKERGAGLYDIPGTLFTPAGEWRIAITFAQKGFYDTNATIGIDYPHEITEARAVARQEQYSVLEMLSIGILLTIIMFIIALVFVEKKNIACTSLIVALIALSVVVFLIITTMKVMFSSNEGVLYNHMNMRTDTHTMPPGMDISSMQM